MARIFSHFDDYQQETFDCPQCSWSGSFAELSHETHRDLFDGSCPRCQRMLLVVSFPTAQEITKAAAEGDERALEMLPTVEERREIDARFEREGLKNPDQLPEIPGANLDFIWDLERVDGDEHTVIRCGDRVIWREPAFYEGWPRFNEVKSILIAKYGDRFNALTPMEASMNFLYGDDLGAPSKISYGKND